MRPLLPMPLSAGTRIGSYEVTAAIGAGGMGEVYRAHDTKLGRDVALKVLPPAFAGDPERLARFKREAHVLAALNHPHIAQIYGVEDSGPTVALVLELVDGPTLAEIIDGSGLGARGAGQSSTPAAAPHPFTVTNALPIARQIAEALIAAHDLGIIHRDLKPSNIKVSDDGDVKVLDFGLAKLAGPDDERERSNAGLTNSPTLTSPAATALGLILGTAAYMAPEQAKGQKVDKRADVWAFGCVLYEMLTGRRPFAGEDVSDTLASVLKQDPDWTALPADLPTSIRLLLERCLVKDRKRRIADLSTALFLMDEGALLAAPRAVAAAPRGYSTGRLVAAAGIFTILGAAIAILAVETGRRAPVLEPQRLSVVLPADRPVSFGGTPGHSLAISPDGKTVVYLSSNTGAGSERATQLRVRSLDSSSVRDLSGTFRARQPFFSPDGQWVGFFTQDGELKKVSLAGGTPVTLATKINGAPWSFGIWLDDNTIVFGAADSGLAQVSADAATDGSAPRPITTLDKAQGERDHRPLSFLREAGAVLFQTRYLELRDPRLEVAVLASGERRKVLDNVLTARLVAGTYLLFRRDDSLLIAPFDQAKLVIAGSAVPLTDEIRNDGTDADGVLPQAAVSETGTFAYMPAEDDSARVMGIVDRMGRFEPIPGTPSRARRPRASPDGLHITYEVTGTEGTTVHVYDVGQKTTRKLTESGSDQHATWFDNKSIVVTSRRADGRGIYLKQLGGGERLLYPNETNLNLRPESFSPDGVLAFNRQSASQQDIWLLTSGDKPTAQALIATAAAEYAPRFSPDGRWLAYVANDSGRVEVRLRGYPDGETIPVSSAGGSDPVWSRDSRTLFFRVATSGEPKLMAVPVSDRGLAGSPVTLFDVRVPNLAGGSDILIRSGANIGTNYDALPDGRFVTIRGPNPQGAREIVIVQNWFEELKRLVK